MGQQQILLLVVAAIVVVIAITIGIQMFTANAQLSNRDSIVSNLITWALWQFNTIEKHLHMVEVYHSNHGQFPTSLIQLQTVCIV